MAVRLSLGATRKHKVLRQLLTESVLLALAWRRGQLSSPRAMDAPVALTALMPPDARSSNALRVWHWNVVLGVSRAALSLCDWILLLGLFPALQSSKPDIVTVSARGLGANSPVWRTVPFPRARFRNSLVTVQIALSMALLDLGGPVREESLEHHARRSGH